MSYEIVLSTVSMVVVMGGALYSVYWCCARIKERFTDQDEDIEYGYSLDDIEAGRVSNKNSNRRAWFYLSELDKLSEEKFDEDQECCICMDEEERYFVKQEYCLHNEKYCKGCLVRHMMRCVKINTDFSCPLCRECIVIPHAAPSPEYDPDELSVYTQISEDDQDIEDN